VENSPKSGRNWLTRFTTWRMAVVTGLQAAAILPESGFAVKFATIGAWIALISGFLYGLPFWGKARIGIFRLNLRYKIVPRNTAVRGTCRICVPIRPVG